MLKKKSKGQSRLDSTRKRHLVIVEAAAGCFIAKGFHQSSMRDIATSAGVSLGNLYNHFENKADLIKGLAEIEAAEIAGLIGILSEDGPQSGILRKFTNAYLDQVSEPGHAALTAEIFAEALRNKDIHEIFAKNQKQLAAALVHCLEKKAEQSSRQDTLAPSLIADHLLTLIENTALRAALRGAKPSRLERKILHALIEKILHDN